MPQIQPTRRPARRATPAPTVVNPAAVPLAALRFAFDLVAGVFQVLFFAACVVSPRNATPKQRITREQARRMTATPPPYGARRHSSPRLAYFD